MDVLSILLLTLVGECDCVRLVTT